jgi:hypothetical protein
MHMAYESTAVHHELTSRAQYKYFHDSNGSGLVIMGKKKEYCPKLTQLIFFCKNHQPEILQDNQETGQPYDDVQHLKGALMYIWKTLKYFNPINAILD